MCIQASFSLAGVMSGYAMQLIWAHVNLNSCLTDCMLAGIAQLLQFNSEKQTDHCISRPGGAGKAQDAEQL